MYKRLSVYTSSGGKMLFIAILLSLFVSASTIIVKLGDKERFDKEKIGVKELFTGYQPFYTINLLFLENATTWR